MSIPVWTPIGSLPFPFHVPFSHQGLLLARPGRSKFPITGGPYAVADVAAAVGTAPLGGPIILDLNVNGESVYDDPAAQPTIPVGATLAVVGPHTPTVVTDGDVLTVDLDTVGTELPGADLVVNVRLMRTG